MTEAPSNRGASVTNAPTRTPLRWPITARSNRARLDIFIIYLHHLAKATQGRAYPGGLRLAAARTIELGASLKHEKNR